MAAKPRKKPVKPSPEGAAIVAGGRILRWSLLCGLPLLALATWCLIRLDGWIPQLRHAWHVGDALNLGRCLGGAVLAALAIAVVLPIAHWVRLTPMERFATGSKVVWYVPMLLSLPVWLALYALVPVLIALGAWACWTGLHGLGLDQRLGLW